MRFTKNIRSSDYKQLNGQRFTVENITEDGQITISSNGKTQDISIERLLHSDYSYVDTVHSSQGQTADYCIYSAANAKSLTIGRESFYVAASRARQEFVVYTANAIDLGVTIQQSRANENAHELVQSSPKPKNQEKNQELNQHFQHQQRKETVQKSHLYKSANTSKKERQQRLNVSKAKAKSNCDSTQKRSHKPSIKVEKLALTPPQQKQTTKTKSEPQNQLSKLNDAELVNGT